jgi:hypothetical protein
MQAAMALGEPIHRAVKLSELGREQHQIGRDALLLGCADRGQQMYLSERTAHPEEAW